MRKIQIVFDGPPGPEGPRFIEVEEDEQGISFGEWRQLNDGRWAIEFDYPDEYRVIYTQGNGYGCSCCRRTHTEIERFSTVKEAVKCLSDLKAAKEFPIPGCDDYDNEIGHVLLCGKVDLKADPTMVSELVKQRKATVAKKEAKKTAEEIKKEEAEYLRLKKKFEKEGEPGEHV